MDDIAPIDLHNTAIFAFIADGGRLRNSDVSRREVGTPPGGRAIDRKWREVMPDSSDASKNKAFVIRHFDDFVNRRDLSAIDRNMTAGFLDHDGPGGRPTDRSGDRAMMEAMHRLLPDLRVEVKDAVAEADKVVVRNVWTATDPASGRPAEFHGFVMWRVEGGKIAERWATVTPFHELAAARLDW